MLKYPPITSKLWLGTFWVDIYLDWYGVCETCIPKNLCLMVSVLGLPMLNPTIGYFGGSGVYAVATIFLHLHIPFLHLHIYMQWEKFLHQYLFFLEDPQAIIFLGVDGINGGGGGLILYQSQTSCFRRRMLCIKLGLWLRQKWYL